MADIRVHTDVVEGRSHASGLWRRMPVAWLDRETDRPCPRCGEGIPVDPGCPVVFDPSVWEGGTQPISQQHGCGEWLAVDYLVGVDGEDPAAVAARLAEEEEEPHHA